MGKSIVKKIILIIVCLALPVLPGCFKKPSSPRPAVKKEFDVRALVAKLKEIQNYSYTVSTVYSAENGLNYESTYTSVGNRFKETRIIGNQTDIIYVNTDEKMLYSYNPWMEYYTKSPISEATMEQFYTMKDNILYTMHIPTDLDEWNYTLIREDDEVAGESCVVVKDSEHIGERTIYISKDSGFPLKMEYADYTVTVTNVEIETVSDTELSVPDGVEYKENYPSKGLFS